MKIKNNNMSKYFRIIILYCNNQLKIFNNILLERMQLSIYVQSISRNKMNKYYNKIRINQKYKKQIIQKTFVFKMIKKILSFTKILQ